MATTVIDSAAEIKAFQAEADGIEIGGGPEAKAAPTEKATEKPAEKEKPEESDADDIEGDDGLTARQKRELSAKMLKAIGKKHRELKEAEEFAAAQYSERQLSERRAQQLEQELQSLKAKEPAVKPAEDSKPQRDKYKTDEAYWEAMTDWRVDQKLAQKAQDDAQAAAQERQAQIIEAAKERVAKASELVPDYLDAIESASNIPIHEVVLGYMQQSDMLTELSYHLAKHPEIAAALQKKTVAEQLVTIGKIESTLKPFESKGDKDSKKPEDGATPSKSTNGAKASSNDTGAVPSRARDTAPVIKPLNGSGAVPAEVSPADMNIRETIHDWSKKHQVNLGLRKRH